MSFATATAAELHSEALAAGALAANALRGEGPAVEERMAWADEPAAWAAVPGVWAGIPTEPANVAAPPSATGQWTTRGLPIGIGAAVLAAALFAVVLGNPFGAGRVESEINPTSSPAGSSRLGGAAGPGTASPGAEGTPTVDVPTDPTDPTATGRVAGSTSAPVQTPRPTATPTPGPGSTATPTPRTSAPGATPTPTPPATPTPTPTAPPPPTPTPSPAPTPTPTPPPTPTPTPACRTVPNLVGLTVLNARSTWSAAGFSGGFTPAKGQNNRIVATQNRTPGACLPANTSVTVTLG